MQTNLWTLSDKIFSLLYLRTEWTRHRRKREEVSEKQKKLPGKEKMPVPDSVKNRKDKMFTNVHSISDKYGHFHTGVPW